MKAYVPIGRMGHVGDRSGWASGPIDSSLFNLVKIYRHTLMSYTLECRVTFLSNLQQSDMSLCFCSNLMEDRHNVCFLMQQERRRCLCGKWTIFYFISGDYVSEERWRDLFSIALDGIAYRYWGYLSDKNKWAYNFIIEAEGPAAQSELKRRFHWCSSTELPYDHPLQDIFGPDQKMPSVFKDALYRPTCCVKLLVQSMCPSPFLDAFSYFGDVGLGNLVVAEVGMFEKYSSWGK